MDESDYRFWIQQNTALRRKMEHMIGIEKAFAGLFMAFVFGILIGRMM